jgi:hypothetical protein
MALTNVGKVDKIPVREEREDSEKKGKEDCVIGISSFHPLVLMK